MSQPKINLYEVNPFNQLEKVKSIWLELQNNCQHSFFLSWSWMESWLKTLDQSQEIHFIYGLNNDTPFIGYFIGLKKGIRNKLIYANRAYLNSTGDSQLDEITIEYNSILFNPSLAPDNILEQLLHKHTLWDELVCPAVTIDVFDNITKDNDKLNVLVERTSLSHFVKLEKVRQNNNDLLSLISKNKRAQIRRSLRYYEKNSKLILKISSNRNDAIDTLEQLKKLHNKQWNSRGQPGSFSSSFFNNFHSNLINNRFDDRCIHIIKISNDTEIVGYLYNFIYKNNVLFYQNGFNYKSDNRYKPGLVSHYLAINYYAKNGFNTYDFLANGCEYKKSLSTDSHQMQWLRVRKNKLRFKLEDQLRHLKSLIKPE